MAACHEEMMALPEDFRVGWEALEGGVETDESVNKPTQVILPMFL